MKRLVTIATAALMMTGCASVQRLSSYGTGQADAQIGVQGRRMNVWLHPSEASILTGMTVGDAAGGGFLRGATFGLAGGFKPDPREIDASLAAWLAPTGCSAAPVREIGKDSINFEAAYRCPAGVDLPALVESQREALMLAEPIRVP